MLMIPVLMGSGGCWGRDGGSPDEEVCGFLGTAVGIEGAYVHVYPLDEVTGRLLKAYPIAITSEPTDANGEFCLIGKDSDITGMLLFVARGGEIREYWSDTPAELGVEHLSAVVEHWTKGRPLSITPWTTLAYKLAKARYGNGEDETFFSSILTAERLLYEHFIGSQLDASTLSYCDSRLNCLRPALNASRPISVGVSPQADNYTLTLLSLSALAAEWSGPLLSVRNITSVKLTTEYLSVDAADGRFDGFELEEPLETNVNTLRSDIARAFAVNGPKYQPYAYLDHSSTFERIASNTDPGLFGEGQISSIDDVAPSVHVMSSPIFDERDDRIDFDESRNPTHIHNTASITQLEDAFESGCPEIHKHVNLLNGTDVEMNPLRWRFAVRDETTGIAAVRAEVSFGPSYQVVRYVDVTILHEKLQDGGHEAIVTVTANDVPELLTQEGEFRIAIIATDGVGNESIPLEGCWKHVPRAAPLWVGPVTSSNETESILNYSLEHDNISALLNESYLLDHAPILVLFELFNPNSQAVYLTLSMRDISSMFAWTWDYTYIVGRREQGLDSCIQLGRCMVDHPQEGHYSTPVPNPSAPVNTISLTTTSDLCNQDCLDFPILIEPKESITIKARWLDFEFMLPEEFSSGKLREFPDPVDNEGLATGIVLEYVHCLQDNGDGTCSDRQFYEKRVTMRAARLDVSGIISGETFASPAISPRRPIGQQYTFGIDHEFEQSWITYED